MFVRTIKGSSKQYAYIVENKRDASGKTKQRQIQRLGEIKDAADKERLYRLGNNIISSMKGEEDFIDKEAIKNIKEERRENWVSALLANEIFSQFKLDEYFAGIFSKRKIEYDITSVIKFMVMDRFINPRSKLSSFNNRQEFTGFKEFELQHLYRSLDELDNYKEEISRHIYNQQRNFIKGELKAVLFDVTTLYFESQKSGDLQDFGYSKDCKFNEVQIVLSLVINNDGRPIGYEVFPGNTSEGSSLLPCLSRLKERYKIRDVIIVADRGMSSFNNLKAIKEAGFDYIVASKLRCFEKDKQNQVLDLSSYQDHKLSNNKDEILKYKIMGDLRQRKSDKVIEELSDKLLCLYSSKRGKKDKKDRERLITKAEEMIIYKNFKDKRGAKKYIIIEGKKKDKGVLDIEKIKNEERFDGFYTINYSKADMVAEEVASTYHSLWQIEESFRTMKDFFETRPIFHWTKKRISGHVMLNFIALVMEKHIEIECKNKEFNITRNNIRDHIKKLERSILIVTNKQFAMYSNINDEVARFLKIMKIKLPQNHFL